jgi:hypothetical protein
VTWRFLARTVAGIHIAYAVFVILGSLLVLAWPPLLAIHLAAVAWAAATLLLDLGCPLTPWEKSLLARGGMKPYNEGFLQHYLPTPPFQPEHERRNHMLLGALAVLVNAVVYALIFGRS